MNVLIKVRERRRIDKVVRRYLSMHRIRGKSPVGMWAWRFMISYTLPCILYFIAFNNFSAISRSVECDSQYRIL